MARTRRTLTIDDKIANAQKKVDSIKAKLESAQSELNDLLSKKADEKKAELWEIVEKSEKSLDEIIDLIK